MADLLHPLRLYWENAHGFAKCGGVRCELPHFPAIDGLTGVTYMDYIPGTHVLEVRIGAGARREMTGAECAAVLAYLKHAAAKSLAHFAGSAK